MDLWFCESSLTPKSSIGDVSFTHALPKTKTIPFAQFEGAGCASPQMLEFNQVTVSAINFQRLLTGADDNEMSRLFMMIPPKKRRRSDCLAEVRFDKIERQRTCILKSPKSLINSWRIGMHLTWSHGTSKEILNLETRNFQVPAVWHQIQNGVFDGYPHRKSHRIGTPSLSIKARAAQAQQVGKGWFWFSSQSLKKKCFTMVPILSNLQFALGFQGLGMAKLLSLPSQFLNAPVRLDTRRSGAHLKNPKAPLWVGLSTTQNHPPKKRLAQMPKSFPDKTTIFWGPNLPRAFAQRRGEQKGEAENHEMKEKQINC